MVVDSRERLIAEAYAVNELILNEGIVTDTAKNTLKKFSIKWLTEGFVSYMLKNAAVRNVKDFTKGANIGRAYAKEGRTFYGKWDLFKDLQGPDFLNGFAWGQDNWDNEEWSDYLIPESLIHELFDNFRTEQEKRILAAVTKEFLTLVFVEKSKFGVLSKIIDIVTQTIDEYNQIPGKQFVGLTAIIILEIVDELLLPILAMALGIPPGIDPGFLIWKVGINELVGDKVLNFFNIDPSSPAGIHIKAKVANSKIVELSEIIDDFEEETLENPIEIESGVEIDDFGEFDEDSETEFDGDDFVFDDFGELVLKNSEVDHLKQKRNLREKPKLTENKIKRLILKSLTKELKVRSI